MSKKNPVLENRFTKSLKLPPVLRSFTQLITGWASYLLPQQFRGDLVTSQQQPEEGLQLDDPI